MNLDILIQITGLIFAGFSQGVSGFGLGLLAVSILISYHSPRIVIPSLVLIYIFTCSLLVYEHRKEINKDFFKNNLLVSSYSLIIALFGMLLGSFILSTVSPRVINLLLGLLISSISVYYFILEFKNSKLLSFAYCNHHIRTVKNRIICYLLSWFSGLLEGFAGIGGPPIVIFMLYQRYNPAVFITTISAYSLILSLLRVIIYQNMGLFDFKVLTLFGFILPFITIGFSIGIIVRRRLLSDKIFRRIVILVLLLIGLNQTRRYI